MGQRLISASIESVRKEQFGKFPVEKNVHPSEMDCAEVSATEAKYF